MLDPTKSIENMAQQASKLLGEPWDFLDDRRKERYRALAFHIYEEVIRTYHVAIEDAISEVNELQVAPSTPKRWLPGVKEASNALAVMLELEKERTEIGVMVPERLPDGFSEVDPYDSLVAGDKEPHLFVGDVCGAEHEAGWTCTRHAHDPSWKHWDADRDYKPDLTGDILATWYDSEDGDLESLHPNLVDSE